MKNARRGLESYWKRREMERNGQSIGSKDLRAWKKRSRGRPKPTKRYTIRKRRPSNCQLFHVSPIRLIEPFHFLPRVQSTWDNVELSPTAGSVNLPSKPPRTSVNVFSRVPRGSTKPCRLAWATVSQITGALFRCRRYVTPPGRTPISGMAYFCFNLRLSGMPIRRAVLSLRVPR